MDITALETSIRQAFADTPYPGDENTVGYPREEPELLNDLKGRTPWDLPQKLVEKHFGHIPLLTDDGKKYFLPAYMLVALRDPESIVGEFTVCSLDSPCGWNPTHPYSRDQVEAVLDFIEFMEPYAGVENTARIRQVWERVRRAAR